MLKADLACVQAASKFPEYTHLLQDTESAEPVKQSTAPIGSIHRVHGDRIWCMAIYLTCMFVAEKVLDTMRFAYFLRSILCNLHQSNVTTDQCLQLEAEVLMALDWRLGVFSAPPAVQEVSMETLVLGQ